MALDLVNGWINGVVERALASIVIFGDCGLSRV